jgi:methionine-rich copper-binding protein CopC
MFATSFSARRSRKFVLAATLSLPFVFAAAEARAHAHLEKATPAAGAIVATPSEIRLTFSEGVEPRFSGAKLTAADRSALPLGAAKVEAGHPETLVVPIAKPLPPGVYTVHWHAVSVDTHHTQGDFQFTVKP